MGSRIVFFLTEDQAAVLRALAAKKPPPDDTSRATNALRTRGLASGYWREFKLTPLGDIAATLASAIAPASPDVKANRNRRRRRSRPG